MYERKIQEASESKKLRRLLEKDKTLKILNRISSDYVITSTDKIFEKNSSFHVK